MRKYHPDYLGHNEYITDITGRPYQYFHYSAFGETLVEDNAHYGQFSSPYRFNGKDLDPETGNYYYGARYYHPVWGIWLGVDPMSDKRPNLTSYNFVSNNPVVRIDPSGMLDGWVEGEDGKTTWDPDVSSQKDLVDQCKSGTYKGESGKGFNPETGNSIHYFEDGTSFEAPEMLAEAPVDGGQMSDHARTMQNPIVQIMHGQQEALVKGFSKTVLQDGGDALSLVGYGLTLTGVGAPLGLTLSGVGNGMSLAGSGIDLAYQIGSGDRVGAGTNIGFMLGGAVLGATANRIPGSSLFKQILKQNAELKLSGINRIINYQQERE